MVIMSHAVTHAFKEFVHMPALIKAFEKLGWNVLPNTDANVQRGTRIEGYTPSYAVCPGSEKSYKVFDVGITPLSNGTISLRYNHDYNTVENALGKDLSKLKQQYNLANIELFAESKGGTVEFDILEDGTINFTIDVPAEVEVML